MMMPLLGALLAGRACLPVAAPRCTCVISLHHVTDTLAAARQTWANSSHLFTGRVIGEAVRSDSLEMIPPIGERRWWKMLMHVATVVVGTRLKGAVPDTVLVQTSITSSCGGDLTLDEEYLFDTFVGPSNVLEIQFCGFNRPLAESARLIEYLTRARTRE